MSRSDFYRKVKPTRSKDKELIQTVIHYFKKHHGIYGRIRICKDMQRDGIEIEEHKVGRILRENGLFAKGGHLKRKHPRPTKQQYIEENLIEDKFSVTEANYLWCSDITEFECEHGRKLYLCGVIDVATRRIVGWSIANNERQQLVQEAFKMAVGRNPQRPEGAIYHSDRGSQFTAQKTKELVAKNGFRRSMSRPGKPSDNQPIESFWATMKRELPDIRKMSYKEAEMRLVKYIEMYYNADRLHSGIDYHTPNEFLTSLSVRVS